MISIAFLLVSLWFAWRTLNALQGPGRRLLPHRSIWLTAMLTGELAIQHFLVQVALTALFVELGALDRLPGEVALVITLASWVGLAAVKLQAQRAGTAMEAALTAALGAGYREEIAGKLGTADRPSWPQILLGYPRRPGTVERIDDIPYREGDTRNTLDLYRHVSRPTGRPAVLQVHGGGWTGGHKRQQARPLLHSLAAAGWIAVSAAYPLSPSATFPEHLIALKQALAWIRLHGPAYGIDPSFVAVTGGSAGGHLASLLALTPNRPEYQPGFEEVDTSVQACAAFYGVYDFLNRHDARDNWPVIPRRVMKATPQEARDAYEQASPLSLVRKDAPPFLVVHGSHDSLVPREEAHYFVDALRKVSRNPVGYAEIPGANHAFDIVYSLRTAHVVNGTLRFLTHAYARHTGQARQPHPAPPALELDHRGGERADLVDEDALASTPYPTGSPQRPGMP